MCFAGKVCGPVRSTCGTPLGEDKLGASARILNTKVACRARAGPTSPHRCGVRVWADEDGEDDDNDELCYGAFVCALRRSWSSWVYGMGSSSTCARGAHTVPTRCIVVPKDEGGATGVQYGSGMTAAPDGPTDTTMRWHWLSLSFIPRGRRWCRLDDCGGSEGRAA